MHPPLSEHLSRPRRAPISQPMRRLAAIAGLLLSPLCIAGAAGAQLRSGRQWPLTPEGDAASATPDACDLCVYAIQQVQTGGIPACGGGGASATHTAVSGGPPSAPAGIAVTLAAVARPSARGSCRACSSRRTT